MDLIRKLHDVCAADVAVLHGVFPDGELTWDEVMSLPSLPGDVPWKAWFARYCPAEVEGSTWEARLAAQKNQHEMALLAQFCPAGVKGSTWEARLSLVKYDGERASFGRNCPVLGEQDTWVARLALQHNDFNKKWFYLICPAGVEGDPR